jgi:hypothetical protein
MAGLSWVRVDASLASNHKVLALMSEKGGDHALNVFIFGLGHCAQHGTDGFIPAIALGLIHGKPRDAAMLVQVGLWHELPGGYEVHDYREFQPSDEESQKRSDKARKAAEARWEKSRRASIKAVS